MHSQKTSENRTSHFHKSVRRFSNGVDRVFQAETNRKFPKWTIAPPLVKTYHMTSPSAHACDWWCDISLMKPNSSPDMKDSMIRALRSDRKKVWLFDLCLVYFFFKTTACRFRQRQIDRHLQPVKAGVLSSSLFGPPCTLSRHRPGHILVLTSYTISSGSIISLPELWVFCQKQSLWSAVACCGQLVPAMAHLLLASTRAPWMSSGTTGRSTVNLAAEYATRQNTGTLWSSAWTCVQVSNDILLHN